MKICLCGSTRFMEQFNAANRFLTLNGHIVYSVAVSSSQVQSEVTNEQKIVLDLVHLRKIIESDAVVVVGQQDDGSVYIGDSTRREILWASLWNKWISYWSEERNEEFYSPVKEAWETIKDAQMSTAAREAAGSPLKWSKFFEEGTDAN